MSDQSRRSASSYADSLSTKKQTTSTSSGYDPDSSSSPGGTSIQELQLSTNDLKHDWAYMSVCDCWALGYKSRPLVSMFNAVQPILSSAIAAVLLAAQLRPASLALHGTRPSTMSTAETEAISSLQLAGQVLLSAEFASTVWELNTEYGFHQLTEDQVSADVLIGAGCRYCDGGSAPGRFREVSRCKLDPCLAGFRSTRVSPAFTG